MQDFLTRIRSLSPQRLALLAVELQSKLEAAERARVEPIAIVSMACRFPGAESPEAYWALLRDGVDAIRETPLSRWDNETYYDPDPDAPGKIATRWGGYVEPIDAFEPQLFGISGREALSMDPQQRLLLEVTWEAMERAGIPPEQLSGSATGVFVGVCNSDYGQMLMAGNTDEVDAYLSTGNAHSIVSGRLSYTLGLQGPSISVDTACSSSLVALHLAVQSLRTGECRMALAGGVNAILSPVTTITLSRARMMASDGRCKAFDAAADGFVRGEGCGIVILKRLRDAQADGDAILAVIRGSALNQDGRSNGITAPNGPSQVAVIREALANAGLAPEDIQYVEAHGTGTSLGDPIEVQALGAALGLGRADRLKIGSAKSNIGHLESAAGIAGVIKLVLMLQHGEIPPHLHLTQPSPHIPWAELPIDVPTVRTQWSGRDGRRIGGVSSFGFSGTNAHVILESAPELPDSQPPAETGPQLLLLSARTQNTLRTLAGRYAEHLAAHPEQAYGAVAQSANMGRARLAQRLALVGDSSTDLQSRLAEFAAQAPVEGVITGSLGPGRLDLVFLFTGQAAHYAGMGRELYETYRPFRNALDECAELLAPHLDIPLTAILFGPESGELLGRMEYAQPALCALQVALAALWQAWGVTPDVVAGHSAGEYAAAIVAGIMTRAQGLALSALRGRLMAQTAANAACAMATLFADEETVALVIAQQGNAVSIAAINGPESVVISGAAEAVKAVVAEFATRDVQSRQLALSVAAHSPMMEPILDAFEAAVRATPLLPPQVEFVSGLTGMVATSAELTDPLYWRRQTREPVRWTQVTETLRAASTPGAAAFVEIGPHPTLIGLMQHAWPEADALWAPSLRSERSGPGEARRGQGEVRQMLESLGALAVSGVVVSWVGLYGDGLHRRVQLPTYPFERQTYRLDPAPRRPVSAGAIEAGSHPLLGARLLSPGMEATVFETELDAQRPAFIAHHRIHGMVIAPAPLYLEMALAAGAALAQRTSGNEQLDAIDNLSISEPLVLEETTSRVVQIVLKPAVGAAPFQIFSRSQGGDRWTLHAQGELQPARAAEETPLDLAAVQARCCERMDAPAYYTAMAGMGLAFGEQFRGLVQIWRRDGEALGRVDLPESLLGEAARYSIHPALLDACFHLLGAPLPNAREPSLLVSMDSFETAALRNAPKNAPITHLWSHVILRPGFEAGDAFAADLYVYDDTGALVAKALGMQLRSAGDSFLRTAAEPLPADWFYTVAWQPKPLKAALAHRADAHTLAAQLRLRFDPLAKKHGLAQATRALEELEALSARYTMQALVDLGWRPQPGEIVSAAPLAAQLGVEPKRVRLLGRLLEICAEVGLLASTVETGGAGWRVLAAPQVQGNLAADAEVLRQREPTISAEVALTQVCGAALADALRGAIDPLHLLFPNGSLARTEALYRDTPAAHVYNTLVGEGVRDAVESILQTRGSEGLRPLRILEIGAGSGATTRAILAALEGLPALHDSTEAGEAALEYWFTDLSPLFMARARQSFDAHPIMRLALFDVESAPESQGLPVGGFDIVVAANVLHATADLRATLAHVRSLLAPAGLLLLLEGSRPRRWVDITFGLTDGWWRFADSTLRTSHPLLSAMAWQTLLAAQGFDAVESIPPAAADPHQALFIARADRDVNFAQADGLVAGYAAAPMLVFSQAQGESAQIVAALQAQGVTCDVVHAGDGFCRQGEHLWQINADVPAQYTRLLEELPATATSRPILYLWALDALPAHAEAEAAALLEAQTWVCAGAVALTQALARADGHPARLWLVTRGAQAVTQGDKSAQSADGAAQAPLWGIGRVLSLELPELWGGLTDLEPGAAAADDAAAILGEMSAQDGEDAVALRNGLRLVPRLEHTPPPPWRGAPNRLDAEGAYLITGGLGGLGLKLAQRLADRGAGHIVLAGRTPLPSRAGWETLEAGSRAATQVKAIQAMETLGAQVHPMAVDVGERTQMQALFARFGSDLPPLRGIIHAAADLSNWTLRELPRAALQEQLRAKLAGGWLLHELSLSHNPDFFVLFSSTTALWGASSLAHYAAANQALDALAHYRRGINLPALSVNWGTWDEMRVASADEQRALADFGLMPMRSSRALDALEALLATSSPAQVTVAAVEWSRLRAVYESRRARPLFANIKPSVVEHLPPSPLAAPKRPVLLERLAAAPPDAPEEERRAIISAFVRECVAQVLGNEETQPGVDKQGLFEMGMDSLMAIELKGRLEAAIEQPLPSTLTFNYPNIEALTGYLFMKTEPAAANGKAATSVAAPAAALPADELSEDELAARIAAKLARLA